MSGLEQDLKRSIAFIEERSSARPRIGIILGSGLGEFAGSLHGLRSIKYSEIPHFPVSTTPGHAGRLCLGRIENKEIVVMQGRIHYYEGYPMEHVTYPVRILAGLGVQSLIVTNASGAVNRRIRPGSFVILSDQINLMGASPLVSRSAESFPRSLVDLSEPYDEEYAELALRTGLSLGLATQRGVAGATSGPSYETPAEIRMLRQLGADTVSMSTIPEVIVARALGLRVLGISCITNLASGVGDSPLTHEEVLETSRDVAAGFTRLLREVLAKMGE